MGMTVEMTNGSRVTIDKSFIRNVSKIYWILLLLDWLGVFVNSSGDRRQKFSDRIAGTIVVQKSQPLGTMTQTQKETQ